MNPSTSRLKDITVLYCEDEQDLREVTQGILQNFTKKQFIGKDGCEGLELFKANQNDIDLIITDVNMPNMNGLEMTKEIKAINPDMPIIVATAFSNSEYLLEAIELGVDKYVLKPINIKKLLSTMNQSLLYHELRDLYKDALTHLPTRNALVKDLKSKQNATIVLIDIDKFSVLNDLYGEDNGDKILVKFSECIKKYFAKDYVVYRVGADKFALMLNNDEQDTSSIKKDCLSFSSKIEQDGIVLESLTADFGITIGIACASDGHAYEYAQRVIQKARVQYEEVMEYDPNTFEQKKDIEENLKWIKKLKTGIADGDFQPFFQPIVDVKTKEVYKYESLIRYIQKDGTEVPPFKFLPIAKKAKLYPVIIRIMLMGAIGVIWEKGIKISVNVSYEDIFNSDTKTFIYDTLESHPKEAKLLDFELLESEEIEDFELVKEFIEKVRTYGCRVGIDDFGAGYSNFNMLEALNVDFVKIDGSLIKNVDTLPKQALIVETISNFCKQLGIKTVAEFVSEEEIYNKVKDIGVTYAQGWYFGKAVESSKI